MIISLLVAVDEGDGIGQENRLPWRLPSDLKRFKALTMGHHIIMGRKTYETIGRPLPGRISVVVTRQKDYAPAGTDGDAIGVSLYLSGSLPEALAIAAGHGEQEAFVIGGGEIFREALPLADRLYLTRVHTRTQADTFFPPVAWDEWSLREQTRFPADDQHLFASTYQVFERIPGKVLDK